MIPLKAHCERVQRFARDLEALIAFPGEAPEARPPELAASLRSLRERTERPELRVLILGPLKSGKSTLMNVLVNNPFVSQISQLPAYPCFVEVRDIERAPDGGPAGTPRTVFHPADGARPLVLPPAEGAAKLNELLEAYIERGEQAPIDYRHVEQRIDMRAGGSVADFEGLDLILVDSPGLFFEHRIDREVFRFGPSGAAPPSPGAASSVREFYSRSDVIIFTLRWEQLFFHLLTDYLRQFRRDLAGFLNLKAFILVNASSHSLVQEGAAIRPYDQVAEENQARLRHYFEKHVGDPELIAALRDGSRISLHFCDLLDVAKHLFHPGGEDAPGASRSVEVIREIRRHIFDQGLPQQKAEELDLLAGQCRSQAAAYLDACRAREDEALEGVERRILELGAEVQELAAEAAALEQQFDSIVAEVKAMRTRLERVAVRDFGKGALDAPSAAFLLMERRLLDLELEEPPEAETAREQLTAAYRAWREGVSGPRSLAALPAALWRFEPPAESADHEPGPLKRLYESACARVLAQFEKAARDLVNEPELVAALDEFGADDVAWPLGPPETLAPAPPLLGFTPRRGPGWGRVRFRPLRVFLALTPAGLWGGDGRREITAERELAVLEEETEGFLEQIWDEPWRFRDCFEPERLKTRLLLVFEQRFCLAWATEIVRRIEQRDALARRLKAQLDDCAARLDTAKAEVDTHEKQVLARRQALEELDARRGRVAALSIEAARTGTAAAADAS